jgi:hypothetical protein
MPVYISGTNGVTFPDSSLQAAAASPYVLKNRLINGAMMIDQRNAGSSITGNEGVFGVDRFRISAAQSSKMNVQQNAGSVTPPVGFGYYLGVTSTSAYTVGASERFVIQQRVESNNVGDLAWGTANAKAVVLSFWVRSSLTGTFGGSVYEYNTGVPSYPFSYTISSANTWTQISISIPGPTSGTWYLTGNSGALTVQFGLGVGSSQSGTANTWSYSNFYDSCTGATSVVGTNGATFYITGVQFELGTTATPFERRLYGQELINCQRYYYRVNATSSYTPYGNGWNASSSSGQMIVKHPVRMRVQPTSIDYTLLSSTVLGVSEALVATATLDTTNNSGTDASTIVIASSSLFTSGFGTLTAKASTSSYLGFNAEL